jgi:Barstar (barnase inhibitor)
MSGLAGVLAGRRAAGAYRWTSHAHADDVAHAVEHAGWRFVRLDTVRVEDEQGFVEAVWAAYGLSGSPGTDVGAVDDALAGVRHDRGVVTLWEGWSPFARAEPGRFTAVLEVLTRRCRSTRGGAFVVLLRGEGPALDLPELDPHGAAGLSQGAE